MKNDQKVTILNVDDDEAGRYAVTRILRQADFDVREASNGREALQLAEEQPDLIILDVNLPDISGFEVCRMIKSKSSTAHIPILHLSATYLNNESKVRGLENADGYLTQPVEPPVLIATVKALLRMKRAENALRESEDLYRDLVEHSKALIYTHDLEGRILSANKWPIKVLGYDQGLLLKMTIRDILAPEAKDQINEYLSTIRREGSAKGLMLIQTAAGEKRIWEYNNTLRTEGVKDPIVRGIAYDVTEFKKTEEELRQSEKKYRRLYDSMMDAFVSTDMAGRIQEHNQAYQTMLGYSDEELHRLTYMDLTPAKWHEAEAKIVAEQILPGGHSDVYEKEYRRKDGTIFPVELRTFLIREKAGQPGGMWAIVRDLTERKKAEQEMATIQEQLRQSQKIEAIGRLAGGIAHDFNNLLTIIQGNAELSLFDLREGDPFRANIEEIKRASGRAAELTRQLLAFSRKQILEMKVLDLNQVLQRLDKMLRRIIGEDIELLVIPVEPIGTVKADPGQMEQVILNIAVNAKDAMPDGGKLTIETANVELDEEYARTHVSVTPGRYVMLSMSDTGAGMTPEVRERIFEPFFTTKEMGKGTGLGLSTVYGIVKQSGGNIWVYSEPGQGTTFKIYLPQVDEPLEELREEVVKEVARGNETILVVEDEETVRKLAVRVLKRQGYKVLEASDGGKAFMLCEEFRDPIHLILTDVVMPGMSGRKLVDRLKAIHPEMKVLYMSGYTDNAILHHGILEPGTNFIQKPFNVDGLARKVRGVLDR